MSTCVWTYKGYGPQVYRSECSVAAFIEPNPPKEGEDCILCGEPVHFDHDTNAVKTGGDV